MNTDERITNLESKLAFQEHTIDELNGVILEQQRRIDQLEQQLRRLTARMDADPLVRDAADEEPPPHY